MAYDCSGETNSGEKTGVGMKKNDRLLRVAIIGLSELGRDTIPWQDPAWQKWGLLWDPLWRRLDRSYDIHSQEQIDTWEKRPRDYGKRPREIQAAGNLCVAWGNNLSPTLSYPEFALVNGYCTGSIAAIIAHAIWDCAAEISLHGVEINEDGPYSHQRACIEFYLGMARGDGAKLFIPDGCSLLTNDNGKRYGT